jgi:hypothetical protein
MEKSVQHANLVNEVLGLLYTPDERCDQLLIPTIDKEMHSEMIA